jgi:hypothetical protein
VIVADGTATDPAPPPAETEAEGVVWLRQPGASVFELRAAALRAARGEIVALTEDHCVVDAGWCAKVVDAHARHPSAAAVGGVVANGSVTRWIDEANYLLTFGPYMPGAAALSPTRSFGVSNVSLKRRAIDGANLEPGWVELVLVPRLHGAESVLAGDIGVTHIQSHGFWNTFRVHFHNGRSTAGLITEMLSREDRAKQLTLSWSIPFRLTRETLSNVVARRWPWHRVARLAPFVFLLALCHTAGLFLGALRGSGRSPWRLV